MQWKQLLFNDFYIDHPFVTMHFGFFFSFIPYYINNYFVNVKNVHRLSNGIDKAPVTNILIIHSPKSIYCNFIWMCVPPNLCVHVQFQHWLCQSINRFHYKYTANNISSILNFVFNFVFLRWWSWYEVNILRYKNIQYTHIQYTTNSTQKILIQLNWYEEETRCRSLKSNMLYNSFAMAVFACLSRFISFFYN